MQWFSSDFKQFFLVQNNFVCVFLNGFQMLKMAWYSKTKDGLLKNEDILLKTKDRLLKIEDILFEN